MNRGQIAAAPISWGVCEVDGWGVQVDPSIVIEQMRELGYAATELGPAGFLPEDPEQLAAVLADARLQLAGAFVAPVLHRLGDREDALAEVDACARMLAKVGTNAPVVLACATGAMGYELHEPLDEAGWRVLVDGIDAACEVAASRGVGCVVHPHVGTMVETAAHVDRVMMETSAGLCLDTGHLLAAGADPVAVMDAWAYRVRHVHLKDVRAATAIQVRESEISYADAVAGGMYVPVGTGDVAVADMLAELDRAGYNGWIVVEQDRRVVVAPADGSCASIPARDDAAHAFEFLTTFDAAAHREVAS